MIFFQERRILTSDRQRSDASVTTTFGCGDENLKRNKLHGTALDRYIRPIAARKLGPSPCLDGVRCVN